MHTNAPHSQAGRFQSLPIIIAVEADQMYSRPLPESISQQEHTQDFYRLRVLDVL